MRDFQKSLGPLYENYYDFSCEFNENIKYPNRLENKLKQFKNKHESKAFMNNLFREIGHTWGPVLYHFTDWILKNAHYPHHINVLLRDGECIKRVYDTSFKEHLKDTTSLSAICLNHDLLSSFKKKSIDYCEDAGLTRENTLVDSGVSGSIIEHLHLISPPFRSEMLMFFSINPYIKSFLTDYDTMWPFYKQTFGNKKESLKLQKMLPMYCYESFCVDLLEMFESFPKSCKRPYLYKQTKQGVQPVLKTVDKGTLQLHNYFYQGVEDSLKNGPVPDLIQSLTILYNLWLANLQQPDQDKKYFFTIEYEDKAKKIGFWKNLIQEVIYLNYDTKCLRHSKENRRIMSVLREYYPSDQDRQLSFIHRLIHNKIK